VQVEFHTGVAQPMHFACRLLRKAYRQGARVAVVAPPETLRALDRELWTFDERDFVPHVKVTREPAKAAQLQRTPLWLFDADGVASGWPEGAPEVLVNLGADLAPEHINATRLIEIVARDADEADRARLRWRHYKGQGWAVIHHPDEGSA
jgi:DNA polymerase III subunit chi